MEVQPQDVRRLPKAEHRPAWCAEPEEGDAALRHSVGERQPEDVLVEGDRAGEVADRQVCLEEAVDLDRACLLCCRSRLYCGHRPPILSRAVRGSEQSMPRSYTDGRERAPAGLPRPGECFDRGMAG